MATVTGFDTLNTLLHNTSKLSRSTPVTQTYFLVATWQHPETGKTYTFKTPIRNRAKFPIGSSVAFLVDYQNPRMHCLEDTLNAFTRPHDETRPAQG